AARMAEKGDVWAASSQDYDSLLFGAPRLVRNLAVTGKRKLPGKSVWVDVEPEMIELSQVLEALGLTRQQLVEAIRDIFLKPEVTDDYSVKFGQVNEAAVRDVLVRQHDFGEERVKATFPRYAKLHEAMKQRSLDAFFG